MMPTMRTVRIGNAQAFWGDRADAAAEMLAREPELDYLTLDYLAEVSLSILAMQRERDPQAGFARDFIDVVRSLGSYWNSGGRCRIIANAGGLNPRGCAEACQHVLAEVGCRAMRIGVVSGDDVLEMLRDGSAADSDYCNLDTGEPIRRVRDRLVTANAYLGAAGIVEALAHGADIVITGRVADPSLAVAPCLHHFGWQDDELDRLAGATVAGHLIECGTQVTGGISTDWLDVPDPTHIGFPVVEIEEDGSCIVTKPRDTGGCVSAMTVKEQLVYEIGDPDNYVSPDVTVSFLPIQVDDLGNDRVRVSGASGKPRTDTYKVSATFRDGFRSAGTITIIGRNSVKKARRCGELVLRRVHEAGYDLRATHIECFGQNGGGEGSTVGETVLRIAVEADTSEAAEQFSRELMPLITSGPQGTTGYAEGRPRVHPVFRYWPCLIPRNFLQPSVEVVVSGKSPTVGSLSASRMTATCSPQASGNIRLPEPNLARANVRSDPTNPEAREIALYDIACARSGDKGANANIGVIARSSEFWEFLRSWLTADRVARYFSALEPETVKRYELSNIQALNFILRGALRQCLRTDVQGKALGQMLLEMPIPDDIMGTVTTRR
jgi:hypothetical protein